MKLNLGNNIAFYSFAKMRRKIIGFNLSLSYKMDTEFTERYAKLALLINHSGHQLLEHVFNESLLIPQHPKLSASFS